jgi:dihydrofolate reductase
MEAAVRKIIESTLVSADGVIGDPPRWAMEYRDAEVTDEALERLASADAMLMGRGTYELFSAVWPGQSGEFADRMNSIRKYVFSATLDEATWNNSVILRGDAVAAWRRPCSSTGSWTSSGSRSILCWWAAARCCSATGRSSLWSSPGRRPSARAWSS